MKDPLPTFTTFVERIRDVRPNLAYIHVIEARVNGNTVSAVSDENRDATEDLGLSPLHCSRWNGLCYSHRHCRRK